MRLFLTATQVTGPGVYLVPPVACAPFIIPRLSAEHMCWGHPCGQHLGEQGWTKDSRNSLIPGKTVAKATYSHPEHGKLWIGSTHIYHSADGGATATKVPHAQADAYLKSLESKPAPAALSAPASVQETPKAVSAPAPAQQEGPYRNVSDTAKAVAQKTPLTAEELDALFAYKTQSAINGALYGKGGDVTQLSETAQKRVATLDSALAKGALKQNTTLYRFARGSSDILNAIKSSAVGATLQMVGYQSTSTNPAAALYFNDGVMLRVSAPKGTPAHAFGGEEKEVLLPRNVTYEVKSHSQGTGKLANVHIVDVVAHYGK